MLRGVCWKPLPPFSEVQSAGRPFGGLVMALGNQIIQILILPGLQTV